MIQRISLLALAVASSSLALAMNPVTLPDGRVQINKSELLAYKNTLVADPMFAQVRETIRTLPNEEVEQIVPGRAANPSNVRRVEAIMPESTWDFLTPVAAPEYTYVGFLRAIGKFPAFCGDYDDGRDAEAICRRALATTFAHFVQETGGHSDFEFDADGNQIPKWRQGLYWVREMGFSEGQGGYNSECSQPGWQTELWPCGKTSSGQFQGYWGRGAKQLSYHYNYGPFSQAIYGDPTVLLNNPALVADTWLNLASAIFFYVYPQPPKPSMLHVMDGTWQPNAIDAAQGIKPGFGATINVINGGVECGHGVTRQAENRVKYYKDIAPFFGVEIQADEELTCATQGNFIVGGAGALNIQWEDDWGYNANHPGGKTFACQLVGYQTAESALVEGDYIRCVQRYYPNLVIVDDIGDSPRPSPSVVISPSAAPSPTMVPSQLPSVTLTPSPTRVPSTTPSVTLTPIPTQPPVSGCAQAVNYQAGSSYSLGDIVRQGNNYYRCTGHAAWCSNAVYDPAGIHGSATWEQVSCTAQPSASVTVTPTVIASPTRVASPSVTLSPTVTQAPSATSAPSATVPPSATVSPSVTVFPSVTYVPTRNPVPSVTPTAPEVPPRTGSFAWLLLALPLIMRRRA